MSDHFSAYTAVNNGWNINLVKVLRRLEAKGVIKIDYVDKNCSGNIYFNPTTIIQWTKA